MTLDHDAPDLPPVIEVFRRWASTIADRSFESVDAQTHLTQLGLDSMSLIELIAELEDEFSLSLCDAQLEGVRTLGELETLVLGLQGKRLHALPVN